MQGNDDASAERRARCPRAHRLQVHLTTPIAGFSMAKGRGFPKRMRCPAPVTVGWSGAMTDAHGVWCRMSRRCRAAGTRGRCASRCDFRCDSECCASTHRSVSPSRRKRHDLMAGFPRRRRGRARAFHSRGPPLRLSRRLPLSQQTPPVIATVPDLSQQDPALSQRNRNSHCPVASISAPVTRRDRLGVKRDAGFAAHHRPRNARWQAGCPIGSP